MKKTLNYDRPHWAMALLVTLFATLLGAWALPAAASDKEVIEGEEGEQTLNVYLNKNGYDEKGGYCYFSFSSNIENAIVYYSIDGGEERAYLTEEGSVKVPEKGPRRLTMPDNFRVVRRDKEGDEEPVSPDYGTLTIAVGSTLSYYATAEGYESTKPVTVTARAPFWSKLDNLWYEGFYVDDNAGQVITLADKETVKGFYQMMAGERILSEHLLTPNENINEEFLLTNNGIWNNVARTFAVTGLTKGQALIVYLYTEFDAKINPTDGLVYDDWNSEVYDDDPWKRYAFEVTTDGIVQFVVDAGGQLSGMELMGEKAPERPYFYLSEVKGANRTYEIDKPDNATTLYYTTAVANEIPAIGGTAWASTTDDYIFLTVSGVGRLYAYAENNAGTSDIAVQEVNGVVQTLAPPYIGSKWFDSETRQWKVDLQWSQTDLEGSADVAIYYSIDGGEFTAYTGTFAIANGSTLSFYASAEDFNNSPTVTLTAKPELSLQQVWGETYYYYYTTAAITLGDEVETGLHQLMVNGSLLRSGYLLTPNENIDDKLRMTYRDGIRTDVNRTFAVANLKAGQYLYLYTLNGKITPGENTEADLWNNRNDFTILRVTADGTAKFTLSGYGYLQQMYLYQTPEYGDVEVADANGNILTYHYNNATSPAMLMGIVKYADDEDKAGRIIIHDEVTDANGNTHVVNYIAGSLSNRYSLVSVVFGQNILSTGGVEGTASYTFEGCSKLESVTLNSGLKKLAPYTFSNTALKQLNIPASVETLGNYALANNSNLATITFESGSLLTAIPNYCFYYDKALTSLTLPDGIQTVGSSAFYGCSALTELTFGPNLAEGGLGTNRYLFYYCSNMEKITLPGLNYPFGTNYYGLPATLTIYVDASMVETYKTNSYTKSYHIVAIGSTIDFVVNTTADSRLPIELAKQTDTPSDASSLTIIGPINGTDINYIHQAMPFLSVLNLKDAQIVEGGDQYAQWNVSGNTVTQYGSKTWSTQNDIVGPYMFADMPNLKRITLPDGATEIGEYALARNYKMEEVTLPSQLKTIGNYAFYMYNNIGVLKQLTLPNSLTAIGKNAFYNTALTAINIPEGVTLLDDYTFYSCDNLAEVTLPSTLTTIGKYALAECGKLTAIVLPDALTTIGEYAFYDCHGLATVNMPAQLVTVDNYAFYYTTSLAAPLTFPASCQTIGSTAFGYCEKLTTVTFNEGLTTIGTSAFYRCRKLKDVVLPESLTSLGDEAFGYNDSLKTFTFPKNIKQVPNSVLYLCKSLENVTLAEGTTYIGSYAFYGCTKLSTFNFQQPTLTTISSSAFQNTGLVNVTLPDQITSLGSNVFESCQKLQSINMPTGINAVPSSLCRQCTALTTVTMHDGIRSIGSYAFSECTALPTIQLNDQLTTIADNAFAYCTALKLTTLPAALTTIGQYAFRNTKSMAISLTLPNGLKTIGYGAFYASRLKGVILPEGITSMGTEVFSQCDSLANVTLPADMKTLPSYTFYYDKELKAIELPLGLETIDDYAFQESGITTIHLPMSLLNIGYRAFANTQLTEFTIPKNVTSVEGGVAANCKRLKTARLGRKMDYTQNSSFDYFTGCDSLTLLRVYAGTPPTVSTSSWNNTTAYRANCVLEVPEGQVSVYQAADIWKEFKEIRAFSSDDMLNDIDYAAIRDLYRYLDGANWTNPWDVSSQSYSNGKWNGVTTEADSEDDELFYITAINLSGQGLKGQLPKSIFTLPRLTSLNLSNNQIEAQVDTLLTDKSQSAIDNAQLTELNIMGNHFKGDLYKLASRLPNLTTLNVSYNWLTDISEKWSNEKLKDAQLYRGYQFIDYATKQVMVPEELLSEVVVNVTPGVPVDIQSTRFQTYRHDYGDFNMSFSYLNRLQGYSSYISTASDGLQKNSDGLWNVYTGYDFMAPKGQLVAFTHGQPYNSYATYILRFDWQDGDVNGDQTVDVSDLQGVIYYTLNEHKPSYQMFNYTAADGDADKKINVTDMVITIDHIMAYEEPAGARSEKAKSATADCHMSIENDAVVLATNSDVAALQLFVSGASASQLALDADVQSRFKVAMRNVDGGVKVVIYSPIGQTLAAGTHRLMSSLPEGATISDVRLTDSEARPLGVSVNFTTGTQGIVSMENGKLDIENESVECYDLLGRKIANGKSAQGIYIINVNGKQYKVKK